MRLGRRHRDRSGPVARLFVATATLLAIAAGCSRGEDTSPEGRQPAAPPNASTAAASSTSSSSPESPTSGEDPTQPIVAAYTAFWEARFKANEDPVNPDDPALREVATGSQLENVVAETAKRKADGLAFRRPAHSSARRDVKVVDSREGEATVQECSVNDGVVFRVGTGEVVDEAVVTHSVEGTLRLVDGRWKVASTRLIQKWEGVGGCALAD